MYDKILLDTNFLLDVMSSDRPGYEAAFAIYENASTHHTPNLAISAGSLKDTYYIARRDLSDFERRRWIRRFINAFEILPIDETTCRDAVDSNEPDFEDGIIRACAEQWQAKGIVSRDAKAFLDSSIRKITGEELLNMGYFEPNGA